MTRNQTIFDLVVLSVLALAGAFALGEAVGKAPAHGVEIAVFHRGTAQRVLVTLPEDLASAQVQSCSPVNEPGSCFEAAIADVKAGWQ